MHAYVGIYIHTCLYTCIHIHTYTHTHTHTQTHLQILVDIKVYLQKQTIVEKATIQFANEVKFCYSEDSLQATQLNLT